MILSEGQMEAWSDTKRVLLSESQERRHRASYDALVVQETFERTRGDNIRQAVNRPSRFSQ